MGSSQVPPPGTTGSSTSPITGRMRPCALGALGPGSGTFNATCEVTNKIDIDKYFELMREEFKDVGDKGPRSPRRTLGRSTSSSNIEPFASVIDNDNTINNNNNNLMPLSPRRKKNIKKRISCDEKSLSMYASKYVPKHTDAALYAAKNNMPKHSEAFFNYDLSGQIIEAAGTQMHTDNHHVSRQKSWDLSKSKVKNPENDDDVDLSISYSVGDFRDIKNNNVIKSSKSCDSLSKLGERHKEHAMMQGKIGSVSQQNRRHRRRYYRKERKNSDEKISSSSIDSEINHLIKDKLVIDNG